MVFGAVGVVSMGESGLAETDSVGETVAFNGGKSLKGANTVTADSGSIIDGTEADPTRDTISELETGSSA